MNKMYKVEIENTEGKILKNRNNCHHYTLASHEGTCFGRFTTMSCVALRKRMAGYK